MKRNAGAKMPAPATIELLDVTFRPAMSLLLLQFSLSLAGETRQTVTTSTNISALSRPQLTPAAQHNYRLNSIETPTLSLMSALPCEHLAIKSPDGWASHYDSHYRIVLSSIGDTYIYRGCAVYHLKIAQGINTLYIIWHWPLCWVGSRASNDTEEAL